MALYLSIIVISYAAIAAINGFFTGFGTAYAYGAAAVAALVFIDAVAALLTRYCIPEKKMNPFARCFNVSAKERRFYEKIGIKKWKDTIPETGKYLAGFAKDEIAQPDNNEYLLKFLRETCYAGIMHAVSFGAGFLALAFLPYKLTIVLPAAVVNAFLQLLPTMVQRYNRYRIKILYKHNEKRAKKENEKN